MVHLLHCLYGLDAHSHAYSELWCNTPEYHSSSSESDLLLTVCSFATCRTRISEHTRQPVSFVESIPCAQMSKRCLHCDTEWCVILTYSWCSSTGLMSVRTTDIRPHVTRVPGCQKWLNPVWHRMLCMATVSVKGSKLWQGKSQRVMNGVQVSS